MAKNKIEIIHNSGELLVINKPSGVSVTKDRTGKADIIHLLSLQLDVEKSSFRLIHRIDKATSGILLIAKTARAQSRYAAMFAKRKIKKTYLAFVKGFAMDEGGVVKQPLDRSSKFKGTMYIAPRRGKQAVTEWQLLADFGLVSLIKASPITGRTHQIRVHMKHIGMPLAIDPIYGGQEPILLSDFKKKYTPSPGKPEKPLIDRLTLHAYQLEIPAEDGFEGGVFVAQLEDKFKAALKMLARHNPRGEDAFIDRKVYHSIIAAEQI
ncbi:RluA family pseudouridine synthase [Limihaloglobus sulfuriphilus]|uniref:RluA family pseudouridine synthase n=1 Tax=Limihaloglobus sulfuriphilus TaxID=1851148 RepID=UPI001649829F|nr:RNA pseudouridine synthase [Limihaloglobus sulfuriphilus]